MFVVLDSVVAALANVIDPETHRPITEPNIVSPGDVIIDDFSVNVKILLITAECPSRDMITTNVKSAFSALESVEDVTMEMGVMNDEQRKALREKLNGGRPEEEIPFAQPGSFTRIIVITSGKGGVGKSPMTVNLAAVMAKSGLKVGVMDADIYGSSIPRMFGITRELQAIDGMILPPLGTQGVEAIPIGMFVPDGRPVIWHGPMFHHAFQQLLADVFQGNLNVSLIDMPPDTGDVVIPIAQLLPNSQVLVVTTPQVAATEVAERASFIASQTQQRVIGAVESVSYLPQPDSSRLGLFGSSGGASASARLSAQLGYETLLFVQVPLDIALRGGGGVGRPVTLNGGPAPQALGELVEKLSIAERGLGGCPPGVFPVQK